MIKRLLYRNLAAFGLASIARVEKWFRRNCQDVLRRECSVQEKGRLHHLLSQIN